MGLNEVVGSYEPKENAEFKQKELIGDAVAELELDLVKSKAGKDWIILRGVVINTVPDKKGRETTIESGDEVATFYDPTDDKQLQKLADDLFTCGIVYEKGESDSDTFANMQEAVKGKLGYYRTYMGKKFTTEDDGATFKEVPGEKKQKINILSSSKISDEMKIASLPF